MFGRSAKPTRHLLIGNVGPGLGQQHDAIAAALAPLGCVNVHVPQLLDKAACYVFASFETDPTAAAALEALHERPCSALGDRVLTAKYAAEKRRSKVGAAADPVRRAPCRTSQRTCSEVLLTAATPGAPAGACACVPHEPGVRGAGPGAHPRLCHRGT